MNAQVKPLVEFEARTYGKDIVKSEPQFWSRDLLKKLAEDDEVEAIVVGAGLWELMCSQELTIRMIRQSADNGHVLQGQIGHIGDTQMLTDAYLTPESRFVSHMSALVVKNHAVGGGTYFVEYPMVKRTTMQELRAKMRSQDALRGLPLTFSLGAFQALSSNLGVNAVLINKRVLVRLMCTKAIMTCMSCPPSFAEVEESGMIGQLLGIRVYIDIGEEDESISQNGDYLYTFARDGSVMYRELDL